ncbi:MAG: hypothetical protein ACI9ES_000658 [Oceanospirillaceae bacterium]|jgi:hypothetical protein
MRGLHIDIENFSLAWRWTSSSRAKLPIDALSELIPLSTESVSRLASTQVKHFPCGATRFDSTDGPEPTRQWLKKLNVSTQKITILWDEETALTLPWPVFCEYWDRFCFPSSDDADMFLEDGQFFLRWNHYEVFEHDPYTL